MIRRCQRHKTSANEDRLTYDVPNDNYLAECFWYPRESVVLIRQANVGNPFHYNFRFWKQREKGAAAAAARKKIETT